MKVAVKNRLLLASLVLTSLATVAFFRWGLPETDRRVDKDRFRVEALSRVNKVLLTSADTTVSLTYDGIRWKVNDRYPADRRMVTLLFATLEQVEPRRPVPASQKAEVSARMAQGVNIQLFADSKLVRAWRVAGNDRRTVTYFGEDDDLFIVSIPGYRVYVASIFEMSAGAWREKRIFDFNWRNFKSLEARFPASPYQDFTVARIGDAFGIVGMPKADTAKLNNYLDAVSLVEADHFIERDHPALPPEPLAQIKVSDHANRTYELHVFTTGKQGLVGKLGDGSLLALSGDRWLPISHGRDFFSLK